MVLLALFVLPGCTALARVIQTPTPLPTAIPTLALDISTPAITNTPSDPSLCAYVLVSKDAPDVTAIITQAYRNANFTDVDARAAAYGENCIDTNTNRVVSFSAMQTDIYLAVPVQDTQDIQALGNWIFRLVPVINQVSAGQLPGPKPGNIGVQFKSSGGVVNLWFPRKMAQDLIQKGVRGSALYDALAATNTP